MENTFQTNLLIYVSEITPRVVYTFDFIFRSILGTEYELTTIPGHFEQSVLPKINYSANNNLSGIFISANSLLFEKTILEQEITTVKFNDLNLFFPCTVDSDFPFDPFACSFYILTRYEEYLTENNDIHGRFDDSENILVKLNEHEKPVVDKLAYLIADKISEHFPEFMPAKRSFRFLTTIDIDNAWAYKNKSIFVSFGAVVKAMFAGKWAEIKERFIVFSGLQKDPYDTYKYILETYKGYLDYIHFFFLLGDRNQYDKNVSHKNTRFRQLISSLSQVCEVGIHPSYSSNIKLWMFETEKKRLEEIILKPVTSSRQHFLKLKLPKTYQTLLKSDISADYTMGFASLAGFRAGTCTAFPFFDLSTNQCTDLIIHPFQVMDVTLKNYLHLNPESAWLLIEKIMHEVREVNGTFISLWHNESLKDSGQWLGWRKVFGQIHLTGLKFINE